MMRLKFKLLGGRDQMAVEKRAISEVPHWLFGLIEDAKTCVLAIGIEDLDDPAPNTSRPSPPDRGGSCCCCRFRRLGVDRTEAGAIALPTIETARIESSALTADARIDAPSAASRRWTGMRSSWHGWPSSARRSGRAPLPDDRNDPSILQVESGAIRGYRQAKTRELKMRVARSCAAEAHRRRNSWCSAAARGCAIRSPSWSASRMSRSYSGSSALGVPHRRPVRQPEMRLRRPVARDRALDGAERRRRAPLSRPGRPRQRHRQQDRTPTSCRARATTPTTPTRCSASSSTSVASISRPRCCGSLASNMSG